MPLKEIRYTHKVNESLFFHPVDCYNHISLVLGSSILHEPESLPGAKSQLALFDGHIDGDSCQSAFDVSRHIIRALAVVLVVVSLRDYFIEEPKHILSNSWVVVLTQN